MKQQILKNKTALLIAVGLILSPSFSFAQKQILNGASQTWYYTSTSSGTPSLNVNGGTVTVGDTGTSSADRTAAVTQFDAYAMSVGETITLSFNMMVGSSVRADNYGIRFGLYNSFGLPTNTFTANGQNLNANTSAGYMAGINPSNLQMRLTERREGEVAGDLMNQTDPGARPYVQMGSAANGPSFTSFTTGVTYSVDLEFTLSASNVMVITATYSGGDLQNPISISRDDPSPATIVSTFDTLGFGIVGSSVNDLVLSDIRLTSSIPEPSAFALLLGVPVLVLVYLRRRR